jgi:YegS/Rv2252/BmrU family lipid kinase
MQSPALIPVIINAASGTGYTAEWAEALAAKFSAVGLNAQVTLARSGEDIIEAARLAASRRPALVVAGGGDGTINAVASALVETGIALGVIPLGTLNHFARDLGIPLALDDALRIIAAGHRVTVDVGQVNERIFLNNSSLGMYPEMVHEREKRQRRFGWGKWRAFFWAVVEALRRYHFLKLRLTINDKIQYRSSPFIFIGNNEYVMEGLNIGARNTLDDGRLGLYVPRHVGRLGLLRLAIQALFRRLQQARDFDMFAVEEIEIDSRKKRLRIATDGEVSVMEMPLSYRILPKALTVIAPKTGEQRKA